MEKKVTSVIMLTLLLMGMLTLTFSIQPARAEPKTWYVDDSGGADFTRIQDAINAASPGDTIYVYNGIYFENLIVRKDSLTLIGESKSNTVIDGGGNVVVSIYRNKVNVSKFTVRNGGTSWYYIWGSAILLDYAQYCSISDNIVSNSRYGITSYRGRHNIIGGNTISNTNQGIPLYYTMNETAIGNTVSNGVQYGSDPPYGVQVYGGYNNTAIGNTIADISYTGIRLTYATRNVVRGNIVSTTSVGIAAEYTSSFNTIVGNNAFNNDLGIEIHGRSNNNTIDSNDVSQNGIGIRVGDSIGTIMSRNNITDNESSSAVELNYASHNTLSENNIENNILGYAVWLYHSSFNVFSKNSIRNNGISIGLGDSSNHNAISGNYIANNLMGIGLFWSSTSHNTISGNEIVGNSWFGVYVWESSNNKLYHNNFIGNSQQAYTYGSVNTWDDGYPSGGNYWSDYADMDLFTGPSQDELGGDGIWDHPYVIDFENRDRYPFAEPWAPTITATIDVDPDALNLISQGKWITAYIELPEGYDVSEIDISTIKLYGTIYVDHDAPTELGDHDSDGIPDLMVKFNKAEIMSIIEYALNTAERGFTTVSLRITGKLLDETPFEATDTIKLLFPGDVDGDADVDFNDFIIFTGCYGTSIENPRYVQGADFNEDGAIDFDDFVIFAGNYGKTAI